MSRVDGLTFDAERGFGETVADQQFAVEDHMPPAIVGDPPQRAGRGRGPAQPSRSWWVDLAAVATPRGDGGAGDRAEAIGEAIGDVLGSVVVGEYTELGEPVAGVLVGASVDGAGW
ncbi:hypothetical protein ABZ671_27340 [Micromonospora sp. NPDC006766]|uniref:hypothetical protein n=1 Tax=Micromonospora sp. NPDC006766 TaxID=3154778 RepID=UPI0033E3592A